MLFVDLLVTLEQAISFAQYFLSIVQAPGFNAPDAWTGPVRPATVLTLNLSLFSTITAVFNDVRYRFVMVSIFVPLLINILIVFFINPWYILLWFLVSAAAVVFTTFGVYGYLFTVTSITDDLALIYLLSGVIPFVFCGILFRCRHRLSCCKTLQSVEQSSRDAVQSFEKYKKFLPCTFVKRLLIFIVLALGALLLLLLLPYFPDEVNDSLSFLGPFAIGLGIALAVLASLSLLWILMSACERGRYWQATIIGFIRVEFLRLLLVAISVSFIPVAAGTFKIINCNPLSCPAVSRLPDFESMIPFNATDGTGLVAETCARCVVGANQQCPAALRTSICESSSDERFEFDIGISCVGFKKYFYTAAGIMILCSVIGAPVLFEALIYYSTNSVRAKFPLAPEHAKLPPAEAWSLKAAKTRNLAVFLFHPFNYRARYARLFQLLEKLAIAFTGTFVFRGLPFAPILLIFGSAAAFHVIALIAALAIRPYIRTIENVFTCLIEGTLIAVVAVAIMTQLQLDVPSIIALLLLILVGLVIIVITIISIIQSIGHGKLQAQQEEDKVEREIGSEVVRRETILQAPIRLGNFDAVSPQYPRDPVESSENPQSFTSSSKTKPARQAWDDNSDDDLFTSDGVERLVREEVNRKRQQQRDELTERQKVADNRVNQQVRFRMNMFAVIAGLLAAVALGASLLGLYEVQQAEVYTNFNTYPFTVASEFVGYETFDEFVADCCCTEHEIAPNNVLAVMERWHCSNGRIKERLRVERVVEGTEVTAILSGLPIRGVCDVDFATDCSISGVTVTCSSNVTVSDDALMRLW